jgi:hypothetical protein
VENPLRSIRRTGHDEEIETMSDGKDSRKSEENRIRKKIKG